MVNLTFLENPYVFGAVALMLILYGNMVKIPVPLFIKNLFQHPVFQILIFALIVYRANHDPQIAIVIAIVFLIIMTVISDQEIKDDFTKIEAFVKLNK